MPEDIFLSSIDLKCKGYKSVVWILKCKTDFESFVNKGKTQFNSTYNTMNNKMNFSKKVYNN
jgi:hypothetical protein